MHEIITLQLGQTSNYLATHFWNAQESYFTYSDDQQSPVNPDVHWRPGLATDGSETYLPRTVIYDLKGGFGSLRKINALYEASQDAPAAQLWEGAPVVHRQPPVVQSLYQQSLDSGVVAPKLAADDVRYWSDFSRVFYHPRSLNQLYDYELNSSLMPFDKWSLGTELFEALDKEHDIVDRDFRPFVEEADQMQGIQILTTVDDAWGGFAADYVERLRDEYGKICLWVWGLQASIPGKTIDHRRIQLANTAKSLTEISEQASMLVPLAVPRSRLARAINLDLSSVWHTSALLSTGMETAGLSSRLNVTEHGIRTTLGDLVGSLNLAGGQTISRLQLSTSEDISREDEDTRGHRSPAMAPGRLVDAEIERAIMDMDLFDVTRLGSARKSQRSPAYQVFGQSWVYRGIWGGKSDNFDDDRQSREEANRGLDRSTIRSFESSAGFPLLDSFPQIYGDDNDHPSIGAINVATVLSTDTSISAAMKQLRIHVSSSIALEDRETLGNRLSELEDAYRDGWTGDSDEDND